MASDKDLLNGLRHLYAVTAEVADNTRPVSPELDISGQRYFRASRDKERSEWLYKLGQVWNSKVRYTEEVCECGGDHVKVEVVRGQEVLCSLCPFSLWLRICAALIEKKSGAEMVEWARKHPRDTFVREA